MKKLLSVFAFAICALNMFAQKTITVTTPTTWENVYAWIWNSEKQYNERFIPLKQINETTWEMDFNVELYKYKKAGILFTDTNSWDKDMQKTVDMQLNRKCFSVPSEPKERQIVKMNRSGTICRVLLFDCKIIECHD